MSHRPPPVEIPVNQPQDESDNEKKPAPEVRGRARTGTAGNRWKAKANVMKAPSSDSPPPSPEVQRVQETEEADKTLKRQRSFVIAGLKNRKTESEVPKVQELIPGLQASVAARERKTTEPTNRPRLKRAAEFSDINSVLKDMQEQEKTEAESTKDMSKILNVFQSDQEEIDNMPREEKHALYENVLRCIMLPLSAFLADNEQAQASVEETMSQFTLDNYRTLRHLLGVEKSDHLLIGQRVVKANEHIIFALEDNMANLHKNQVYSSSCFSNKEDFDVWRDYHKKLLTKLIDRFYRERARRVTLSITVAEASDVAIKDEDTQTSDPYCVICLKSQEKKKFLGPGSKEKYPIYKTKIIYESLDPVWMDKFQYELEEDYKTLKLSVVMWDKDQYSSDDYMGEVSVPLLSLGEFQEKFDEWKKVGKSKKYAKHKVKGDLHLITQLRIRSFVQNPPETIIKLPIQYAELEAHKQYAKLLIKLLVKENKNYQTELKGLSAFSVNLLEQFALYYGVSEYYQKLMYLNFLFDHWQVNVGFARVLMRLFHELVELKANHPVPMTSKESDLFEQHKKTFRKRVKHLIISYREAIKVESIDGALNVFLLAMSKLFGEKFKLQVVEKNLKTGAEKWYNSHYASVQADNNMAKMLKLTELVLQSLTEDQAYYTSEFNGFDVTSTNGEVVCPKLLQDVTAVLAQDTLFTVTPDTFALYFKLKALNQFIKDKILGVAVFNLNPLFEPFIENWMEQAKSKLMDWSTQVFQLDENKEWPPILPDAADNPILHSSSIVDIFDSVNQSFKFLTTIDFDQEKHYKMFLQNIICVLLDTYVDRVEESCKNAINSAYQFSDQLQDDELVRIASQNKDKILHFVPQKHICTRLNNLEASQNLLEDFATWLSGYMPEEDVMDIFHPIIKKASNSLRLLLDMMSYQINRDMKSALDLAFEHDEEEETRYDTLFAYLNMQLETLTGALYSGIFGKLLSKIFALVMKDLELKIFPLQLPSDHDGDRPHLAKITAASIGPICEFFSADGEGIREGLRDKLVTLLTTACPLFEYDTKDLIKLYKKLVADQAAAKEKKNNTPPERKSRRSSRTPTPNKERLVRKQSANFKEQPTQVLQPEHIVSIMFTRPDDDLALGFAEKHVKASLQLKIDYLFDIDNPEEDVLGRYVCRNTTFVTGVLFVTTNWVCFDPLTEPNRTRLPIAEIAATTKDNPVAGSIHIIMKNQDEYVFYDMDSRMCLQNIMTRAKEQGVKVESVEEVQKRNYAMTLKPAVWRPDEEVTKCTQCKVEFSFSVRKHHCRQCGEIFCADCSSQKAPVPALNYKMERVCDACFDSFPEKYERTQPSAFCL